LEAWQEAGSGQALVIAGAWDPGPGMKTSAANPPGVRFLGPVLEEDLPGLYSACRLFVFPSLHEGFGLPVVEALACGAAVACSDRSSLPEVAGSAAIYFDPGQTRSIAAAIRTGLSIEPDPERSLAQARRTSWQSTPQLPEIYRAIAYNSP
jgi:alpha-1,3-rhamnosyl/mannosyltransferase